MRRFSKKAFGLAAIIHFAGTILIAWFSVRMLFADIFAPAPLWLDVVWWMWLPAPTFLARVVPNYFAYQDYVFVFWSLFVAVMAGFLFPNRFFSRHRTVEPGAVLPN